ncbi:hypothetical protein QYE76_063729 [Lolium multiflorum]|uniref:Uncharacterized protein n=1 Tax=Lolium multiflorum TaxID=4521 RepID=A0AAD8S658_LOLMU|nr:hypothetical protein QYE76_063713 [Lolium multiflorum]KAK1645924.1 hypothetical protein QYE76_063729 [Lolium multiflorum]
MQSKRLTFCLREVWRSIGLQELMTTGNMDLGELLRRRCIDDKAALVLITKAIGLIGRPVDESLLSVMGAACSDPLVSIRKAALAAISEVSGNSLTRESQKSGFKLCHLWVCQSSNLNLDDDSVNLEEIFPEGTLDFLKSICDGETKSDSPPTKPYPFVCTCASLVFLLSPRAPIPPPPPPPAPLSQSPPARATGGAADIGASDEGSAGNLLLGGVVELRQGELRRGIGSSSLSLKSRLAYLLLSPISAPHSPPLHDAEDGDGGAAATIRMRSHGGARAAVVVTRSGGGSREGRVRAAALRLGAG